MVAGRWQASTFDTADGVRFRFVVSGDLAPLDQLRTEDAAGDRA